MQPSDVVRAWFRRVWNEGSREAIVELLAPDAPVEGLGEALVGPEGFTGFWERMRAAFGDVRVEVEDVLEEGDRCYVRCRADLRFGGRPVTLRGGSVCTVADGRITGAWNCWDFLSLLVDMGALPADALERAVRGEAL